MFWSVPGHSESTSVSFVSHGPETAPASALLPSSLPSFAPKKREFPKMSNKNLKHKLPFNVCIHSIFRLILISISKSVFTLSSSVSFSFLSLSLSTAFSSQRRALALRSLAPPEITPDFWKRVPSKATVLRNPAKVLILTIEYCIYTYPKPVLSYVLHTDFSDFLHLMPIRPSKCNPTCIFNILTHKSISTGVLQSFLNVRWLITNYVNHQFGSSQLPQFFISGFHLQGRREGKQIMT